MTTTATYSVTASTLIDASLRGLGVLESGDTADATTLTNCTTVLNMMLKDWQTDGIKLWTVTEYTLPLVLNQTSYTIGEGGTYNLNQPKPLRLIGAFLRNVGTTPTVDIPMQIISRQEYNLLGSKSSTGQVNSVYYEPLNTYGTLKVFLTPDYTTSTNYQLYLIVQRPIYDIANSTDVPDLPSEWFQALRWGLMSELAPEYGINEQRMTFFINRAQQFKDRLTGWDVENASTFFQPDMRSNFKAYR
jgi:hypothetical protein